MVRTALNVLTLPVIPLNILVCVTYILSAWVSQQYAIEPGNVTPVWIPSGLMFAFAMHAGTRVAAGVFAGAFIGNIWAYFSIENAFRAIPAATLNGIGDVLAIVGMALLLQRYIKNHMPLQSLSQFALLVTLGAVAGGLISAVFGVTGLLIFSFIDAPTYKGALLNWWVGDGVGVLLITPLVLAVIARLYPKSSSYRLSLVFSLIVFCVFTAIIFELLTLPLWFKITVILCLPVAFSLTLQLGQVAVYLAQIMVASIAIYATDLSLGPFAENMTLSPLLSLQLFIGLFSCIIVSLALTMHQKHMLTVKLRNNQTKLENLYRHDPLTQLWNRYAIEEALSEQVRRFERTRQPFAVFILDLDDFKSINDHYGHLEGDRVLKEFAKCLDEHIRENDFLGRWGGEEFVLISENNDMASAALVAHKIIAVIRNFDFKLQKPVTASIGYTTCKVGETQKQLLERADEALYRAKHEGKNRAIAK